MFSFLSHYLPSYPHPLNFSILSFQFSYIDKGKHVSLERGRGLIFHVLTTYHRVMYMYVYGHVMSPKRRRRHRHALQVCHRAEASTCARQQSANTLSAREYAQSVMRTFLAVFDHGGQGVSRHEWRLRGTSNPRSVCQ